jgi:hypothetical protein
MSDSDEPITREKKPLSEARLAAIERMKEGRRRSLEAKKKQKEEEKEAKKQMKKKIKMRVEEEMNGLSSLPVDDKEFMEDLRKKAVGEDKVVTFDETKNEVKDIVGEVLEQQPFSSPTEPQSVVKDNEDDVNESTPLITEGSNVKEKKPRGRPKKKKVVVNNYYEDETSSSEEEIVNNYHKKKKKKSKKKKKVQSSSSEEEEEEVVEQYIEVVPEYQPEPAPVGGRLPRNYNPYTNAMAGISFR